MPETATEHATTSEAIFSCTFRNNKKLFLQAARVRVPSQAGRWAGALQNIILPTIAFALNSTTTRD